MPIARYGELSQVCIVVREGALQVSKPGPE
jgi:hypothetical protein